MRYEGKRSLLGNFFMPESGYCARGAGSDAGGRLFLCIITVGQVGADHGYGIPCRYMQHKITHDMDSYPIIRICFAD